MDPTINLDHQGAYLFNGNISNQFTYNGPADDQKEVDKVINPPKPEEKSDDTK